MRVGLFLVQLITALLFTVFAPSSARAQTCDMVPSPPQCFGVDLGHVDDHGPSDPPDGLNSYSFVLGIKGDILEDGTVFLISSIPDLAFPTNQTDWPAGWSPLEIGPKPEDPLVAHLLEQAGLITADLAFRYTGIAGDPDGLGPFRFESSSRPLPSAIFASAVPHAESADYFYQEAFASAPEPGTASLAGASIVGLLIFASTAHRKRRQAC